MLWKHSPLLLALSLLPADVCHAQTPYAGLQTRSIKALSDQQIADLREGRGMGLALPAELNGYPGPAHLLELADQIGLSDNQRIAIQRLFNAMKAETIPVGERLIEQEAALDGLFSTHHATQENVFAATSEIGATQGKLRNAHLKCHLATLALLRPEQIQRYEQLRGYGGGDHKHQHQQ
jgi:Spy/CpxP family protein refolding chaperone